MYCDSYNDVLHSDGLTGDNAFVVSYQSKRAPGYEWTVNNPNNDKVDSSGYHAMYLNNQPDIFKCYWWIASPSDELDEAVILVRGDYKALTISGVDYTRGVCPTVSLKYGVQLEIEDI